jgi:Tol biopolymer transport system component
VSFDPDSPTIASPAQSPTIAGVIMGTAGYMSPEQARGKIVDKRSDIFSFGCVVFEMLTGNGPFGGETVTDALGAVLHREPDWSQLPAGTPPTLKQMLTRCLVKDKNNRLRDIGDARIELESAIADPVGPALPAGAPVATPRKAGIREGVAWLLVASLAIAAGLSWRMTAHTPLPQTVRLSVAAPAGMTLVQGAGNISISPDGQAIVFVGSDVSGQGGLFVRKLSEATPRPLAGTTGATYPFWSPDSRDIAFFADGKLKRVPAGGGDVDVICAASDGRGGTWGSGGAIVFAPTVASCLMAVEPRGGEPRPVTVLDAASHEVTHRFPSFLPDGQHFLFMATGDANQTENDLAVGSLESTARTPLFKSVCAAIYAEPGYLIFASGERIAAQRFDPKSLRLTGDPVKLGDSVPTSVNSGDRVASASANGILVIGTPAQPNRRIAWFNRRGDVEGTISPPPGELSRLQISPDGTRVAVSCKSGENASDLWLIDLKRGAPTRLTFGPGTNDRPIWSPDGKRLAYHSNRNGPYDLFTRPASGGGGDSLVFASPTRWKEPLSWSPDGRWIAYWAIEKETGGDLLLAAADGSGRIETYLKTPATEWFPSISPDGRWIAYSSNESGRFEIYVQSFPSPGAKYQVITGGGNYPRWAKTGLELFYVTTEGALATVPVSHGEGLEFGASQVLMKLADGEVFDVSADGQHILALAQDASAAAQSPTIVLNWAEGLAKN